MSHIVIHCHHLRGHRAQLQGELNLGHISGDGGLAFEGGSTVKGSIIIYTHHPLHPLPQGLADSTLAVTTGNGDSSGEGEGQQGLHQS